MAEEFLLRYLTEVTSEHTGRWADYLAERYKQPLEGNLESLQHRVSAYLETLTRARQNESLLAGYSEAAENRKVVQLVQGSTQHRDRYYLGFNSPYRPEILVSTSVGQEGIDLHRECRHVSLQTSPNFLARSNNLAANRSITAAWDGRIDQ